MMREQSSGPPRTSKQCCERYVDHVMEGLQNNGVCAVNRMMFFRMMWEQSIGKDATRSDELALTSDPVTDPGPQHSPATAIHPASAASGQEQDHDREDGVLDRNLQHPFPHLSVCVFVCA